MRDHKLQHFVHGSHVKDDTQLSHPHGNQTPQEDGRKHGATERDGGCNREGERSVQLYGCRFIGPFAESKI